MTRKILLKIILAIQAVNIVACQANGSESAKQPILKVRATQFSDEQLKKQYWYFNDENGNEVLHGPYLSWHTTGAIAEQGYYRLGKRHGVNVYYDKQGNSWQLIEFKNGVPHGRHIEWYPNGKLRLEYSFTQGKHSGPFRKWSADGILLEEGIIEAP